MASDAPFRPFNQNLAAWVEVLGPFGQGYHLNIGVHRAVLRFEGACWLQTLRFMNGPGAEQLAIVNARRQSTLRYDDAEDAEELLSMSATAIDDMTLADRKLARSEREHDSTSVACWASTPIGMAEIGRLEREWMSAERDWERGAQGAWLQTSAEGAE